MDGEGWRGFEEKNPSIGLRSRSGKVRFRASGFKLSDEAPHGARGRAFKLEAVDVPVPEMKGKPSALLCGYAAPPGSCEDPGERSQDQVINDPADNHERAGYDHVLGAPEEKPRLDFE